MTKNLKILFQGGPLVRPVNSKIDPIQDSATFHASASPFILLFPLNNIVRNLPTPNPHLLHRQLHGTFVPFIKPEFLSMTA